MPVIETQNLTKVFRVAQKEPGVKGAVKALFQPHHKEVTAVDYINFSVERGEIIFVALNLITGVSAFWVMDSVPVIRVVFETHEFARYPLTIYPKAIGWLLTLLIPYGFASFYPASYILERDVSLFLAWGGPLVAAVLLFLGYRFWLFGLRHYASTGS